MKLFKNMTYILAIIIFVILDIPMAVVNAEDVGYSVRAIIPENQVDKNQTYFDLLMKPKQKQVIQVEIYNKGNEDIDIDIHITNPNTNRNGLIDYTNIETNVDESLKIPITKVASIEKMTVRVPAKKSQIVPIQLEMPEAEFDGIILGGIYFEKHAGAEQATKGQISNKFAYVIGLKLIETNIDVNPNLQLKSVKPGLVNYHTAIIANIQNSAPVIVDHLTLKANVFNSNGKEVNQVNVKDYKMAPNSNMDFAIDWKNKELSPGKYTLKLYADTGKQNWNWEKEFVIPAKDAKDLNKAAVDIKKDYTWYFIIGLSIIILILIYIIYRLIRKNKQQDLKR
ncbi:DUF916 and DUF3324 domain-containing protein [Ectobacillus sp. sgz5001026]|uniref:DUF916 and DUF3324 domain-containing protein n=1 Tax=Ectobacillus sp. sgz5001026 TaxID=3242473 RepID=UPI0036D2FEE1